jgi:FtsZ-binding cell division protein ZapB
MISLEQIRLLEAKIARAIDLIRVLKEENATLRKGLDSAQRRMIELEGLVDGFKADQGEIESVIIRTLKNLDELEESGALSARKQEPARPPVAPRSPADAPEAVSPPASPRLDAGDGKGPEESALPDDVGEKSAKGELDIF